VSLALNTRVLPPPSISVSNAIKAFATKGLTATDMVYLLGNDRVCISNITSLVIAHYNVKMIERTSWTCPNVCF